jgi:hypothetical protein
MDADGVVAMRRPVEMIPQVTRTPSIHRRKELTRKELRSTMSKILREKNVAMRMSIFSRFLTCSLIVLLPGSLLAADSGAAMLYANGSAWVNGSNIPKSSAVFSGDLIQTKNDAVANIKATGSNIVVHPDSLVQFGGESLKLEHGSMTVATSKSVGAEIGDVTVKPASGQWTEFRVKDVDGTVQIAANKGDVIVTDAAGQSTTVSQGQETTRQDSPEGKRRRRRAGGAIPGAQGSVLNSPVALGIGVGIVGGVTTWVLLQGDDPASPSSMGATRSH